MRLLITIFCLTFIATIGITYAIVEESDAPFIYYFSPTERAIIIERADGADRHVLMQEMFSSDERLIRWLKWSPSGEWLFWSVIERGQPEHSWALRYDFTELRDLADYDNIEWYPGFATWSSVEDVYFQIDHSVTPHVLSIIEFPTQQIRLTYELPLNYQYIHWSPNGNYIHYWEQTDDAQLENFVTIEQDGTHYSRQITVNPERSHVFWEGSTIIYQHPEHQSMMVENLATGKTYETIEAMPYIQAVYMSPDGNYVIIVTDSPQVQTEYYRAFRQLLLWSRSDNSIHTITNNQIPIGLIKWIPDSTGFIVCYCSKGNGTTHLYTIMQETSQVFQQHINDLPSTTVQWINNGETGLFYADDHIWLYDIDMAIFTTDQSVSLRSGSLYRWSPNGRYLAQMYFYDDYTGTTPDSGKIVWDRVTDVDFTLPLHSENGEYAYQSSTILWHRNSRWMLFLEQIYSGEDDYFFSIADVSGNFYRELSGSRFLAAPAWLPENVPLNDRH